MTDAQQFNAATVNEAVQKAADSLGLGPEQLSYEVLDEGSAGFLGIGARDARISVSTGVPPDESGVFAVEEPAAAENVSSERQSLREEETIEEGNEPALEEVNEQALADEELLSEIDRYIAKAVETMGIEARIDVYDAGEFIAVDVTSEETGLFIGQKGETIDALQLLLNVATYKDRPFVKRIVIDAEGYRQRRVEAIQGMAHRTARRVARERRKVELPPMNSSERRVVHLYLKDNAQVTTFSEGTGENRRVTVLPA